MTTRSSKAQNDLLRKHPQLRQNLRIRLARVFFKELTDIEFVVFWNLPGLDVEISEPTKKYIEERRQKLGLKFSGTAGYDLETKN